MDVDFKGFVTNVSDYLVQADFVFTSRYLGILEAFANKKLVFALYNNKIKEDYLKMSSFAKYMIISKDGDSLALTLINFIKDQRVRNKIIESAFEWVKIQPWDNVSQLYLNLWRER